MAMNKEAISRQISTVAFEAWVGTDNRRLEREERVDNGYRIIDSAIAALAGNPAFLQLEESRDLFVLEHTSVISLNLGEDCVYDIEFTPSWEGQRLKLGKGHKKSSVDVTLANDGKADASISYSEEDKEPSVSDTDSVRGSVVLVRELEDDLRNWSLPYSEAA